MFGAEAVEAPTVDFFGGERPGEFQWVKLKLGGQMFGIGIGERNAGVG
jgi:hypothetical protein